MTARNLVTLEEARAMLAERPKTSKYRNVKTVVDGITFDSKGEAERWQELQLLEKAGEIHNLRRQVPWPLMVNGRLICSYVSDFQYLMADGTPVCEDFKSTATMTPLYRVKKKLMKALLDIDITETGKGKR